MRIVLALGGNALLHRGEHPDEDTQIRRLADLGSVLRILAAEHELLITHGNGPQVELLASETEADSALRRPYPLDVLNAQTQGLIGYWLVRELDLALDAKHAAALVTRVLVDRDDPTFANPDKFVGESYSEGEAHALSSAYGWTMMAQEAMSWRRVVPSPVPVAIPELPAIADLLASGSTVVCCGGGGIPVVRDADGVLHGVVAVVDTDLTSALLATQLGADLLLLTDVDAVHSDYGTEHGVPIRHTSAEQLRQLHFAAGSMGPKVRAACDSLKLPVG
jgi:carbamate kinase